MVSGGASSIATNPGRAKRSLPTFVLLLGLAAETYFLLNDLSPGRKPASDSSAQAPPIGELVTRQNSVKVQNEGELVWEETQNKQTLYRRQSLLTLEGSRAEVAFLDGTGLMVDEKSLILLEKTPSDDSLGYNRIVVRLLHGTLHKAAPRKTSDLLRRVGSKTPEIEIDTGDSRIELSPSSELTIAMRPEDPEGAHIFVQSGEVKVESPHGALTVKPGEEANLPKAGSAAAPSSHKMPFTLLSPKAGQTIEALSGSQPVRFRWNALREAVTGNPQEVEVSRDPGFKSGVLSSRIPAAEPPLEYVEVNLTLPAQTEKAQWYWRVRTAGQSSTPTVSTPENFWIQPQTVPQLRYPVDHAQAAPLSTIDFSWEPFEAATGYELEIEGRAPVIAPESFAHVEQFSPGTTHWRVRARLQDGSASEWSTPRELVIHEFAAPSPVAPSPVAPSPVAPSPVAPAVQAPPPPPDELDEPEIRRAKPAPQHTSLWNWLIQSAFAAEDEDTWIVHLKWREVAGVKKYKIQISRDQHFSKVIAEGEANVAEWDWNFKLGMQNSKGRAYFRVASVGESGVAGAFSKAKPIKIPKSILTSAKYAKGSHGKQEVYSAQDRSDGAQAVNAADAAERGDLESLAPAKPALSKDLAGPRVGPSVTPPPPPASSPVSVTKAVAPHVVTSSWNWEAALDTGYGSMSQTSSAADLTAVNLQSPYLQQKFSISAELTRAEGAEASAWLGEFQAWIAGYQASNNSPNPSQADFTGLGFRFDVLHALGKICRLMEFLFRWNGRPLLSLGRGRR